MGGLASGGMVLVLDDMWDSHLREISVRGNCLDMIERMAAMGLARFPSDEWGEDPAAYRRWGRWGTFDFHSQKTPHPICFAAAFDPDAYAWRWKWCNRPACTTPAFLVLAGPGRRRTDQGRHLRNQERQRGDPGGHGDRRHRRPGRRRFCRRAAYQRQLTTTVFRLGGVDTEAALRARGAEAYAELDRQIKRVGGSWGIWWMKTPLPGVVWCNCPHMAGIDGRSKT